ncbi:MAG TPA: hypothetical protein VHV51_02305, partial [Polyangiaceae bacterium]|nr:hypothetical protein [Polyangiaceae bacterium]
VIGAAAGSLTAWAMDSENAEAAAADRELDQEIGVDGGDIGAPNLKHPPARVNAPSIEATGASNARADDAVVSEGPFASPPGEK